MEGSVTHWCGQGIQHFCGPGDSGAMRQNLNIVVAAAKRAGRLPASLEGVAARAAKSNDHSALIAPW
jgi:hypothetical protein